MIIWLEGVCERGNLKYIQRCKIRCDTDLSGMNNTSFQNIKSYWWISYWNLFYQRPGAHKPSRNL